MLRAGSTGKLSRIGRRAHRRAPERMFFLCLSSSIWPCGRIERRFDRMGSCCLVGGANQPRFIHKPSFISSELAPG